MASLVDNPFAALTIVVAPAILTNASSVLSLGTANRIARVVDRTRELTGDIARLGPQDTSLAAHRQQLDRLRTRGHLLLRALRFFYMSIGSFAAAALISVVGSLLVNVNEAGTTAFRLTALLGLGAGALGVAGLVLGCSLMVHDTRLAVKTLEEDIALSTP